MKETLPPLSMARRLDAGDPLKRFRSRFHIPRQGGKPCVYLCGHSLGLQPKAAPAEIAMHLRQWARLGVHGHFEGPSPWFPYHEEFRGPLARVVGAKPGEAVAMNSLSVNLHLMLATFYRPNAQKFKIITDSPAFPSDLYALKSHLRWHGFNPERGLVLVEPRSGESSLRTEDVASAIEREGPNAALLCMNGVNFLTGQAFAIADLTRAAHRRGLAAGWDLAHAAGNIPLRLHDWNVDFAVWCSYKYLNAGPGAVGGAFVHERHARDSHLSRLAGWWGHDPRTRFRMQLEPRFKPQGGAESWQVSNPQILSLAPLKSSLETFDEAGMPALRRKSERLSSLLLTLLKRGGSRYEVLSPADPDQRGCQVSIRVRANAKRLHRRLEARGIYCDFREPDVLRAAAVPLYNTFRDVWTFAEELLRDG